MEELEAIHDEISENVLPEDTLSNLTNPKKKRKQKKQNSAQKQYESLKNFLTYSINGYRILVGKNNKQNDYLTLKTANKSDLWFHTQKIHGSHVILQLNGKESPDDAILMHCAEIAAFHSKAKNSSHVPVDYTPVKNVKKPSGAKPGMVVYVDFKTLFVTPQEPEVSLQSTEI